MGEVDTRLMSEGLMSRRLMKLDADELDSEVELFLHKPKQSFESRTFKRGNSVCSVRNLEVTNDVGQGWHRVALLFSHLFPDYTNPP